MLKNKIIPTERIRNLYLEFDNCDSNKCNTFICAMVAIVVLGIVKEVNGKFLQVGHTHEDDDALMGNLLK